MHVIPQLRKLERRFQNELVVVGVHSAKFTSEREADNVRDAVRRYGIDHPVVNDPEFQIWSEYGCRAWPTLMFVDPLGKVVGKHEGEIRTDLFEPLIAKMIAAFDAQGLLDRRPLHFTLEQASTGELAFPGKILADPARRRLFIADSNHDRVVVVGLDGTIQRVIGSGRTGFVDGATERAEFARPQGLALDGETLWVADLENHAIRRVDLTEGSVTTVAGTGEQARAFHEGGVGTQVALNSPWDLLVVGSGGFPHPSPLPEGAETSGLPEGAGTGLPRQFGTQRPVAGTQYPPPGTQHPLIIAMAGFHQLWALDPASGQIWPYAGSGREGIQDGPAPRAWLAQPTGLATDGERIYVADSETSAIRLIEPGDPVGVRTLVGTGLFGFGDEDGFGPKVLLQHAQGLVYHEGVLYLVDTYNNKIKRLDPASRHVVTLFGSGRAGADDGPAERAAFREPAGITALGGKLYIADTNNHAIRVADLTTRAVTTLRIAS